MLPIISFAPTSSNLFRYLLFGIYSSQPCRAFNPLYVSVVAHAHVSFEFQSAILTFGYSTAVYSRLLESDDYTITQLNLVPPDGIDPSSRDYQSRALPLSYGGIMSSLCSAGRDRTCECRINSADRYHSGHRGAKRT